MKTSNDRLPAYTRILVVDNQEIMGAGLEKLLSGEKAFEVWGLSTQDESVLIDEIWQFQPDTIILMAESRLTNPLRLLTLLPDYGRLRIISVSTYNNVLEIYDKQHILANNQISLAAKVRPE